MSAARRRKSLKRRRGLQPGQLRARYIRLREAAERDELPDYDGEPIELCYDEIWDPWETSDVLDFVVFKVWNRLSYERGINRIAALLPEDLPPSGDGTGQEAVGEGEVEEASLPYTADKLPNALRRYLEIADCPPSSPVSRRLVRDAREAVTVERDIFEWFSDIDHADMQVLARTAARLSPNDNQNSQPEDGALILALILCPFWVRKPSSWSLRGQERSEILRSLIEHLFVMYPVPEFLYTNWTRHRDIPNTKWACWLILLGQGGSLRKSGRIFSWSVHKKLIPHLFEAPAGLTATQTCLWCEIARLGGGEVEFRHLTQHPAYVFDPTSLPQDHPFLQFWLETVEWLIRYREELTDEGREAILEWAMHQYTEGRRGTQDAFSWSGRRPRRTYEAALEYIREMYSRDPARQEWRTHDADWEYEDQTGGKWIFWELTSSKALEAESNAMRHCVRGYVDRCTNGLSAIFSLRFNKERRVTIEITPRRRRVVEARGWCNRSPSGDEMRVIELWEKEVLTKRPTSNRKSRPVRMQRFVINPCPRCGFLLETSMALKCRSCEFTWDRCPSCGSDWERGCWACPACGRRLEEMA